MEGACVRGKFWVVFLLFLVFSGLYAVAKEPKFVSIGSSKALSDELIARYKTSEGETLSQPARIRLLDELDVAELRESQVISGLVVLKVNERPAIASSESTTPREKLLARIKELKATGLFEYVEPNWEVHALATPSDAAFSDGRLWGLRNSGQNGGEAGADINAEAAWDITTGSSTVVVGVVDSGVRYTHADLSDNMWRNPGETPNDGIDNDGNGYVDDVFGINAYYGTGDPMDDNDHGTHCAGTIGAVANGGGPHVGVAWNVQIMALKFLGSDGSGSTDGAIECIEYAITKGVDVLSNSWGGGGYSRGLADAIQAANDAGIIFIAAAGNESNNNDINPSYPASYDIPNVISVAALDRSDNLAGFSNYGFESVDLGAPGVSIFSSVSTTNNAYDTFNGTSMATPHVSGVAALLKSHFPDIGVSEMRLRLLNTTRPVASLGGLAASGGAVDAYAALSAQSDGNLEVRVLAEALPLRAGAATRFFVSVSDLGPVLGASVIGGFDGGELRNFFDAGFGADEVAGDGVYTAFLVVPEATESVLLNVAVSAIGKNPASESVSFDVIVPAANDDFEDRIILTSEETAVFGNNQTATTESGEPNYPSTAGTHSVWWEWTPAIAGSATITTSGSDFDTTLAVYTGTSVAQLEWVAFNDDTDGLQSAVTFEAQAGVAYKIQVNGYGDATGDIVLNYPPSLNEPGAPVVVGNPADQSVLVGDGFVLEVVAQGQAPLLYQWYHDDVLIDGASASEYSVEVATEDDRGFYHVIVSNSISSATSTASYVAVNQVGVAKENDLFSKADLLTGTSGRITGVSNSLASGEAGEPNHAGNSLPLNSLWWYWTATYDGTLVVNTIGSNFDTTLAVYSGEQLGSLTEVASNDDTDDSLQSQVSLEVEAGETYHIAVDGYTTRSGNIVLDYLYRSDSGIPVNDAFRDRIRIEPGDGILSGDNIGGSGEENEPDHGGVSSPISSVWWYFVAPSDTRVRVRTAGSDFDTTLAVYKGDSLAELELVEFNDDTSSTRQSSLGFFVEEGEVYNIAIDGYTIAEGRISLEVIFEDPIDLEAALDRQELEWTSNGEQVWFAQKSVTEDGVDAAQSGEIGNDETSVLSLEIAGPASVSFWWKVDSETQYDYLTFSVDGAMRSSISGFLDWSQVQTTVEEGTHVLSWTYRKDATISSGADAGWVDLFEIEYEHGYAYWIAEYFESEDPSIIGADADPDGDGLSNLLEYYFGTLPHDAFSQRNLLLARAGEGESFVVLRHARNVASPDVVGAPEWSTNLVDWHESGETVEGVTVEISTESLPHQDESLVWKEFSAIVKEGSPIELFLRVKVQQY